MTTKDFGLKIIKDYPKKGVNFIDINGMLAEPEHFTAVIKRLCQTVQNKLGADGLKNTAILAPEARGFIFAAPVAYQLGLPLVLVRKGGKIPNSPYPFRITNEYTSYRMEVDGDLLAKYDRYIYVDDILATGQTLASVRKAIKAKGKELILSLHMTAVDALKPLRDANEDLEGLPVEVIL